MKINELEFQGPFDARRESLPARASVYLIAAGLSDGSTRALYVGYASNTHERIRQHLSDSRITESLENYKRLLVFVHWADQLNPDEVHTIERRLVQSLSPPLNSTRTENENSRSTGSAIGGAILGGSLFGPAGALAGALAGLLLSEKVNESHRRGGE
jgi:predicted GIY-YIG superfamily endonuclease